ncbi:MAG: DUF126 domain-containing protein [Zestosphaera sp.]
MRVYEVCRIYGSENVCGELRVSTRPFSFLGDVVIESAEVKGVGNIAQSVLVAPALVGSTVGPYVLYALSKRGLAPKALITKSVDPTLVAGCVLADVSLYKFVDSAIDLNELKVFEGLKVCVEGNALKIGLT